MYCKNKRDYFNCYSGEMGEKKETRKERKEEETETGEQASIDNRATKSTEL